MEEIEMDETKFTVFYMDEKLNHNKKLVSFIAKERVEILPGETKETALQRVDLYSAPHFTAPGWV